MEIVNWNGQPAILSGDRTRAVTLSKPGAKWSEVDASKVVREGAVIGLEAWDHNFGEKYGPLDPEDLAAQDQARAAEKVKERAEAGEPTRRPSGGLPNAVTTTTSPHKTDANGATTSPHEVDRNGMTSSPHKSTGTDANVADGKDSADQKKASHKSDANADTRNAGQKKAQQKK